MSGIYSFFVFASASVFGVSLPVSALTSSHSRVQPSQMTAKVGSTCTPMSRYVWEGTLTGVDSFEVNMFSCPGSASGDSASTSVTAYVDFSDGTTASAIGQYENKLVSGLSPWLNCTAATTYHCTVNFSLTNGAGRHLTDHSILLDVGSGSTQTMVN